MGRTAPLTSKRCILYIYSINIGTEYLKNALYSPFFSSKYSLVHNANFFGSCIIHILYTGCAEIKKNNSGARSLTYQMLFFSFFYIYDASNDTFLNQFTRTLRKESSMDAYHPHMICRKLFFFAMWP